MSLRIAILLFCLIVPQSAPTGTLPHPAKAQVTFVQLTDDHIFDDGKPPGGSQPYVQALDDRVALRWAVDQINSLARDTPINFVVHTGDFGLENVDFSQSSCGITPFDGKNGLPPFPLQVAVHELAFELNRLSVPTIYVVSGNNDVADEKVQDGARFDCFIAELSAKLQSMPNHHVRVEALGLDRPVRVGSLRLAGLDTASFKNDANYATACSSQAPAANLPRGCPAPQMKALQKLLAADESPLLLFTHIPDLIDPYEKSQNPSLKTSAWQIDDVTRKVWLTQASQNKLAGIFAGHFHWYQTKIYATTLDTHYLFVDPGVGGKTWVAPPLAGKKQRNQSLQARGFMLVTVDPSSGGNIVTAKPVWYPTPATTILAPTPSPTPSTKGGIPMTASLRLLGVIIVLIMVSGSFGGYLSYLLNKRDIPGEPQPGRWLSSMFLGIGAASLVPLFLKLIGSDIVPAGSAGADGDFDVSKVLEFFGFCVLAAMSGRTFITSVSDRVWRKEVEKAANEAKDQAAQANFITERLVEPQESVSVSKPQHVTGTSEVLFIVLRALSNSKYVLRSPNGLAVEAPVPVSAIGEILGELKRKGWADTTPFAGADRIQNVYWYITEEGRQALKEKEQTA